MAPPTRSRITITREGWCYLVVVAFIFFGAVIRDINLLVLLFGMLVGPLLYSCGAVFLALRGVRVSRQMPSEAVAGEPFDVHLTLVNGKRRLSSWGVAIDDRIEPVRTPTPLGGVSGGVLFFRTPAGESATGTYRACLTQRGQYRLGPLVIASRFPLGLIRRTRRFEDCGTLTVLPRLGRLNSQASHTRLGAAGVSRSSDRRRGMHEGEFLGLREWRSGDSTRWIHWRTSARRGGLIVRQFEQQHNLDRALVLDLWLPEQPSPADLERVELAVSLVATILRDHCRLGGGQIWLLASGHEVPLVKGAASATLCRDGMHELALLRAAPREQLPELLDLAGRELPSQVRTTLVSTRSRSEPQVSAAGSLADLEQAWGDRLEIIDVGSEELPRIFQQV